MITDTLKSGFHSERLIYLAPENNEENRSFITTVDNDPEIIALSDANVIQPRTSDHANYTLDQLSKSDLGVMICLPACSPAGEDIMNEADSPTKAKPTPIGFLSVGWGGRPQTQSQHRGTSIGIILAAPYQNKGYGGEAINWALDWAFQCGGFHRVEIRTVAYNERGMHLYKRLGFVEEGRRREAHWHQRQWYDVVSYSMLEGEWEALRRGGDDQAK